MWGSDSGQKLTVLEGNHPGPIQCMGFNPKYMMLASACTNMVSTTQLLGLLKHVLCGLTLSPKLPLSYGSI